MPQVSDLARVRTLLEHDRPWAAYALGDLSPAFARHCEWRISERDDAVVLVYRAFEPPVVFALGAEGAISGLLEEVDARHISLHLQLPALKALSPAFAATDVRPMWRMVLDAGLAAPADDGDLVVLDQSDLADVAGLYGDGNGRGESPDFFFPEMLDQGTFRGVREHGALVAAAGTHIIARELGVCAIGNVYTRADCRGRGLGRRATAGVVAHVRGLGVRTIVLNVRQSNEAAKRMYESLGFRTYCEFVEGLACRVPIEESRR